MPFLDKFFSAIGNFFSGLFKSARKAYNSLSDEQKAALLHGSGIIDIINASLDKTPAEIRELITTKYPDIPEALLESGLFALAHSFKLVPASNSLEDVIEAIKNHLKSLEGKTWAVISHSLASALSVIFSPPETKVAAIVSLIEYVFQHLIKKQ